MTVLQVFQKIETLLRENGCDSPSFDATCLLEDIGQIGRGKLASVWDVPLSPKREIAVLEAAKRRADGYPLQYLLKTWDFLNLTLSVGEGVLIPRPETELLCETVVHEISKLTSNTPLVICDLCAGSGCVGLGIASLLNREDVSVFALEKSPEAYLYLSQNIKTYSQYRVTAVQSDILTDFERFEPTIDVLVSNPPYIPTADLSALQREVQHEPSMALDGDDDGLRFYRAIAEHWIPKLSNGGIVAVEIGIHQEKEVMALFSAAGIHNIRCIRDFSDIGRVVIGIKPTKSQTFR